MEEVSHLEHLRSLHSRVHKWQPWALTLGEVSDNLGVDSSQGLDPQDAYNRLMYFGANIPINYSQQMNFLPLVLREQMTEPMVVLLLTVGVLYSLWGEFWDALTMLAAILVVIGMEVWTEWRAKRTLAELRNSVPLNTTVLRGGEEGVVRADELVPGDVVVLAHGQAVPADAVVAVCHGFSADESALTGESAGAYKVALGTCPDVTGHPLNAERRLALPLPLPPPTLVCAGTKVSSGRAVCIVVATGAHTLVASSLGKAQNKGSGGGGSSRLSLTPLQLRMRALANKLSVVAIILCTLVAVTGLAQGMHWRNALLMGMSLAFATIPEELPLIARASLALGSRVLARHGLLVRKLAAADALGSVSVIVTDKTGTLTRNQLVVSSILTVGTRGEPGDGGALAVEVITPEAVAVSERSAALAVPLYAAWSLSVDPLEGRPLAQLLSAVQRKLTKQNLGRTGAGSRTSGTSGTSGTSRSFAHRGHQPALFQPVRGFGKDFMNSAVLQSLPGGGISGSDPTLADDLPRDPDTGGIPMRIISDAITVICQRLPEPTGELTFDPTQRVSARTRSHAKVPVSYCTRHTDADPEARIAAQDLLALAGKHWTVIKGAPEVLLPKCTRVWRATDSSPLSADGIRTGDVDGIEPMTALFSQTLSRCATDIAVGGSRIIAYAVAITDEPLYPESHAHNATTPNPAEESPTIKSPAGSRAGSATGAFKGMLGDGPAFRFRDASDGSALSGSAAAAAGAANLAADLGQGTAAPAAAAVLPSDLIFVGAFAFYDPPQSEARPVVKECQDAGIRVIIATGDHPSTALAVANAVGISECPRQQQQQQQPIYSSTGFATSAPGSASAAGPIGSEVHAITGEMVQRSLSSGTFAQLIDESNVFARMTPQQKLRLVHGLQARGEVVAFIGDGINDAPSLTLANVGICMGGNPSTADIAMDAAGLLVLSGRFSGVVRALREGRRMSANAEKCVVFYLACKVALVLLFAFLLLVEAASPLTPVQVIFIEVFADLGATWTLLNERAEGVVCGGARGEAETELTALARVRLACAAVVLGYRRENAGGGVLGGLGRGDRAVVGFALALFVTCAVPLIVPSLLLPAWAVVPVAPTLTFLTWILAHCLLGTSMRTALVPLRLHGSCTSNNKPGSAVAAETFAESTLLDNNSRGGERVGGVRRSMRNHRPSWWARANVPGLVWVSCSLLGVVLASIIPPVSAHLQIVPLDYVEWVMVVLSPLLLFAGLEIRKEIRFRRRNRRSPGSRHFAEDGSRNCVEDEERTWLLSH